MGDDLTDGLERAIERYCSAVSDAGFDPPTPLSAESDVHDQLDALRSAVAPMRIPAELEWFWSHWDTSSIHRRVSYFPELISPRDAQGFYEYSDGPVHWPRALLPIGYGAHCHLAVELDYPGSVDRLVYFNMDFEFNAHARSLTSIFEALSSAIEGGDLEIETDGSRFLDSTAVEARLLTDLESEAPGLAAEGPYDMFELSAWPFRWFAQEGVSSEAWRLKGPTLSVAQVQAQRTVGPVVATIVGQGGGGMTQAAGPGAGSLVVVYDGTDTIDVWIPASVRDLGQSKNGEYEYDITAEQAVPGEPRIQDFEGDRSIVERLGLLGDIRAAAEASRPMGEFLRASHAVVASAVRPVEPRYDVFRFDDPRSDP